jgi:hypothetical protein
MAWAEASLTAMTAVAAVATCIMKTRRVEGVDVKRDMQNSSKGMSKITEQFIVRHFSHFVLRPEILEQNTQESPGL